MHGRRRYDDQYLLVLKFVKNLFFVKELQDVLSQSAGTSPQVLDKVVPSLLRQDSLNFFSSLSCYSFLRKSMNGFQASLSLSFSEEEMGHMNCQEARAANN
ncbi:hypothetical protein Q3G72_017000 [Acer saccharum]|nr:hypothetical protein Q3G72_017000 [Acer saccharum]